MLINYKEIYNLAWLDSEYFDKQGFLLVKENTNQEVNYVERLVRLKGNLLFILKIPNQTELDNQYLNDELSKRRINLLITYYKQNSSLNSDTNRNLLFVLALNSDFSVRRFEDKNYGFIIEFYNVVDYNHTNLWHFNCLTNDECDEWINTINRTNHRTLKSLFNLLFDRKLKLIKKRNQLSKHLNESTKELSKESIDKSTKEETNDSDLQKSNSSNNLSKSSSSNNLNNNKSSTSLSIISTSSSKESLISKISTTTNLITQNNLIRQTSKNDFKSIYLTDSYFNYSNNLDKLTASYSFTLTINLDNSFKFHNFQPNTFIKVYCSLTNGQNWSVLGRTESLEISNLGEFKFAKKFYLNLYEKIELQNNLQKIIQFDLDNNKILLKFNIYNLIEPLTDRFILIGTSIDYFKLNLNFEIYSSIHYRPLQIGWIKMTGIDNEFNLFNQHSSEKATSKDEYSNDKKQIRSSLFEFGNLLLEPQLFVNTIHRSFQFELNNAISIDGSLSIINITELMAEPVLIYSLVQNLMNIFMDDEKKLMNCITYSLGEVKQEYQRRQMSMLESHLRLVNLVTECINSLNQIQTSTTKFFRQSTQKNEIFFQFLPLNLHLQRSIFNRQTKHLYQKRSNAMETYDILNIFTHGSFSAHRLGFDNGGLSKFISEIENSTKETNYYHLNKIWNAMRNYFKILSLQKKISDLNDKMISLTLRLGKQTDLKLAKNNEFCDDFQKLKIDLQNEAVCIPLIIID